jgi:TIGR00159 family protein
MNNLFHLGIKDAIDIFCVAFFLYKTYRIMKRSGSIAIFTGILSFIAVWILVRALEMRLLGSILDQFVSVGFVILVVLFQEEIRHFLQVIGSNRGWRFLAKLFTPKGNKISDDLSYIMPIVLACMNLSKTKTGALIVLKQETNLDLYIQTGEIINADLSTRLIENIFFKNSPMHDGAVIISGKKIKAAACILPVSQRHDIPKELGLRHRSALGMSQETDAKVIVVSEETGGISVAHEGKLHVRISGEELQKLLAS